MIVYKYGALKPKVIGGTFEDLLAYQRDSNAFYNALIEIERWRIAARDIIEMDQSAPLSDEQKTEHRLAYNAACRAAGQATTIGWGQKQAVTEMVAAAMKTRSSDEFKARQRATKKGFDFVKRVMTCARPRHRRFDGEGLLAATVQGETGLKASTVLSKPGPVQISGEGKHRTVTEPLANRAVRARNCSVTTRLVRRLLEADGTRDPRCSRRAKPPRSWCGGCSRPTELET